MRALAPTRLEVTAPGASCPLDGERRGRHASASERIYFARRLRKPVVGGGSNGPVEALLVQ